MNNHEVSRDDILSGGDDAIESVELPIKKNGAPGVIHLRPLSAGDVVDFITEGNIEVGPDGTVKQFDHRKQSDAMLRLISRTACRADGTLLFDEKDIDTLRRMPTNVYQRLQSRLTKKIMEGGEEGKDAAAEATSEETPKPTLVIDASSTASPSLSASGT